MNLRLLGWAIWLGLLFLPLPAYAIKPVPNGLPGKQTAAFKLRAQQLAQVKTDLNLRIERFEQTCASVVQGSSLEAACTRDQADIRAAKAAYHQQEDTFDLDLEAAIKEELKVINNRIPKTRKELQNLTPQLLGFQDSVDEWLNKSEQARNTARNTVKESVVTLLLKKLSVAKKSEIKLDEGALSRINILLRKRVFIDDLYAQVLTLDNLRSLKTDLSVIRLLQRVQAAMVIHDAVESGDREETLRALLKVIEIACQDPKVTLLIVDGELAIDAAYGWLAHEYAANDLIQNGHRQPQHIARSVVMTRPAAATPIDNRDAPNRLRATYLSTQYESPDLPSRLILSLRFIAHRFAGSKSECSRHRTGSVR
jgi:hypothetical protein